jgi:hypothetical protein
MLVSRPFVDLRPADEALSVDVNDYPVECFELASHPGLQEFSDHGLDSRRRVLVEVRGGAAADSDSLQRFNASTSMIRIRLRVV